MDPNPPSASLRAGRTNKPSKCDLCDDFLLKDVKNRLITAKAMRKAVENGFSLVKEGIALTVIKQTTEGPIDEWRKMV